MLHENLTQRSQEVFDRPVVMQALVAGGCRPRGGGLALLAYHIEGVVAAELPDS
jgi:hypothetical protein